MENSGNIDLSYAENEEESSLNLLVCRELIEMVKSNEFLWKKRCISYKDQERKNLCWTSIGSALTPELLHAEAEHLFYKLRQKFGREINKEKKNAPRSGAGAGEPLYISQWPLYKDLEFLRDVIKPRGTISNFSNSRNLSLSPSQPICNLTKPSTKTNTGNQRPNVICPTNLTKPSTKTNMGNQRPKVICPMSTEGSSTSLWNSDLEGSFVSGLEGETNSSMSPGQSSVLSLKRNVPAPDFSYSKKKKIQDDMVIMVNKQASNLNTLTEKVTKCFQDPIGPTIQPNSEILNALAEVPQENQLPCIIEILQVVQKYITK